MDPTPEFIQEVLRESANAPGYPVTAGTPELRLAIREWAIKRLGASGDFDVLPVIGSKELVAWLPTLLEAKSVLYPDIAYPTYSVGAIIGSAVGTAVSADPSNWPKADLAWINSPSNPTGRVHTQSELASVIEWARKSNSIVASDECYLEFGHGVEPVSILSLTGGNNENIIAVHSLSKRSSMAGYRAGFIIGDSLVIAKLREVRKHAGMMVALPIQMAMITALSDDIHVAEQRERYNARREKLRPALESAGFEVEESRAGLYIWCTRHEKDLDSIAWLAELGILATPGHFYGPTGDHHIRVAMTATDEKINEAAARLYEASGHHL